MVLGGGLLGLEAAKVLSDRGLHVTVVHASKTLMNAQLDELGGEMLEREIERCGIFVRTGRTIETVLGDDRVDGVRLDDQKTLAADMLVLACGVRPRVDLARASGLPINKGIIVNDTLATEAPGVYAVGDCVEHAGKVYGIVGPAWDQVAILADVLAGTNPQSRYRGSRLYTRLKVAGVDVASMGRAEPELESDEVIQVVETRRGSYRKLIVRGRQLVGAILVGNTEAAASLVQAFDRGDPLPENPLEALCSAASLGASGERDHLVCNCHKVSASRLREAIGGGATTLDALCGATKAGTGCGSCKSELVDLITRHAPPPAAAAPKLAAFTPRGRHAPRLTRLAAEMIAQSCSVNVCRTWSSVSTMSIRRDLLVASMTPNPFLLAANSARGPVPTGRGCAPPPPTITK